MSFSEYRKLFPVTLQKIYLNHAAISPMSIRVTDQLDWYMNERSFGSVDVYKNVADIRDQTRNLISKMINAQPEHIAFVSNTSEGFNWLANGLEWKTGDQIILTDYEFPSNVYPFKNLEDKGVEIVYIKNKDGLILYEDIKKAITPKTKILSISFVEFLNGYRNDLHIIGQLCKEHDIIFSVDSIQGVGAIPIDVQKFQIDFLSNGGHKWLMGTMGAGFMYIAPYLFDRLRPIFSGWLAVEKAWDFFDYRQDFLPDSRRFEYATANFLGITALNASVELLMEAGIEKIEKHLLKLGLEMVTAFEEMGFKFQNTLDPKYWSGIFSFSGEDMEELFQLLLKQQIICSLRNGNLRIAPHFYNSMEEIRELIEVVREWKKSRNS
jgi:selenocysteine lyase/cysteine desulfurase